MKKTLYILVFLCQSYFIVAMNKLDTLDPKLQLPDFISDFLHIKPEETTHLNT